MFKKEKPLLLLITVWLIFAFVSCKSYQVASNGYTVEGDEYFINIDKNLAVFLGDDILKEENWQSNGGPINVSKVTAKYKNVLKHLNYSDTAYKVLFTGHMKGKYSYDMLAVINNFPNVKGKRNHLLDLTALQREENREGRYFYNINEFKGQKLLHFVIPFNDRLWQEKMVSMIFLLPADFNDIAWAKDIVLSNVAMYRDRYVFTPSRTEILCPDDGSRSHLDYKIPEEKINKTGYMLMKAYGNVEGKRTLVVYRLMKPKDFYGSFVVCKGDYEILYTTLQDKIVWQTKINTEKDVVF
ncbi:MULTISPECIES: hypothetical protein [Sphingobacterium]|uniref:Uncharacterized protein n=1 Tax=Sphingobacterium athyrii TaxID=2152717 RepID=A0A363NNA2_9SPHI|nr:MULTISPECIES: hypothetical protein [Sphingobacterium]PUV22233.1 hypothetical protein DCO56_21975 [Sphingobacterium athyrii]QIH32217.1 hypothetical protein G6053_04565 [Sphingobacterium sp. DR205]